MLRIGCHLSPGKGLCRMAQTAVSIDANTFQFFARNPRGSKARPLEMEDVAAFISFCGSNDLSPLLVHAPYTLNPCAERQEVAEFAQLKYVYLERDPNNEDLFHIIPKPF